MKYMDLAPIYLCGIGSNGVITSYAVGVYNREKESYSFSNGSYNAIDLSKRPNGSNATYVISATPLQAIDDAGLLGKNEEEV